MSFVDMEVWFATSPYFIFYPLIYYFLNSAQVPRTMHGNFMAKM